jgi:hypothetical protein
MLPSLRQFAIMLDRVQRQVAELQTLLATLIAAEDQPPQPTPGRRRKRWIGPVDPTILQQREEMFLQYFRLSMSLGRDPTRKYFAVLHNLSVSEISRWLSDRPRGIAPGSATDTAISRALRADIARLEASAKRQGTMQIPNSQPRISPIMTA